MRGYDLLKRWQALSPSQQDYCLQWFTGGVGMIAHGFTNGHKHTPEAVWALDQLEASIDQAIMQPITESNSVVFARMLPQEPLLQFVTNNVPLAPLPSGWHMKMLDEFEQGCFVDPVSIMDKCAEVLL